MNISYNIHHYKKMNSEPKRKRFGVIKRIFKNRESVNSTSENGSPALHQAVEAGADLLVKLLLWKDVDVNARDCCRRTALHLACQSHHKKNRRIVDLLLSAGAKVNVQNEWGETPLHVACWSKNEYLVGVLLKNNANLDLVNNKDMTPLDIVARLKVEDMSLANTLLDSNTVVNAVNSEGWSSLHFACSFMAMDTVCAILNKGGDVNLADSQGNTPLHIACTKNSRSLIEMLLYYCAKVNARNHVGRTATHIASLHFLTNVLDVLLDHRADVNAQDSSGNTPLHLAVSGESKYMDGDTSARADTVEKLLMEGAKVDVKNAFLKTPFDELVNYVQQFCNREQKTSLGISEVKRLKDALIKHIIKLKTAGLHVEVDISTEPSYISGTLESECCQELTLMKSSTVVKDVSLYQVLSHMDTPYILSHDEQLAFDDYSESHQLLEKFPLYGHLLRNTFRRWKRWAEAGGGIKTTTVIAEVHIENDDTDSDILLPL